MIKRQLFGLLYQNFRKSEQRNPALGQSRVMKMLGWAAQIIFCLYMTGIGAFVGAVLCSEDCGLILYTLPFIMAVDFSMRFAFQQVPLILIKPYMLLQVRKKDVIDSFLLSSLFSRYNFIWLPFFVSYILGCAYAGHNLLLPMILAAVCQTVILINSQLHLLIRILTTHKALWWLLPLGMFFSLLYITYYSTEEYSILFYTEADYRFALLYEGLSIVILTVLLGINRKLHEIIVTKEIFPQSVPHSGRVFYLPIISHWGMTGEYLKLEIKSTLRNKSTRKHFIDGLVIMLIISGLITFTSVYDNPASQKLWCLYSFLFIGVVNLTKIMGTEGNFIELLMVHKENIHTLLKAKYYFYCIILLMPAVVLCPAVISGKLPALMVLSGMTSASGISYFLLFQLAVYNKQTIPLDKNIAGKGRIGNIQQIIMSVLVFVISGGMTITLTSLFGDTLGFAIMACIGGAFTITHKLWLQNIYRRMMRCRYVNMEGFHDSK